jgi:hypothetical protein
VIKYEFHLKLSGFPENLPNKKNTYGGQSDKKGLATT